MSRPSPGHGADVLAIGQQNEHRIGQPVQNRVELWLRLRVDDDRSAVRALQQGTRAGGWKRAIQRNVTMTRHKGTEQAGKRRPRSMSEDRRQRWPATGSSP